MSEKVSQPLYQREDVLRTLYWDEGKSLKEIAEELDCGYSTVRDWMVRHGIERRSIKEARSTPYVPYHTTTRGTEQWGAAVDGGKKNVYVHRLVAVAEHGFDELVGKVVHHRNGIPWDNRPENLEVCTQAEHMTKHKTYSEPERWAMAAAYEVDDMSSRDVAELFDVGNPTVLNIHEEKFGGEA